MSARTRSQTSGVNGIPSSPLPSPHLSRNQEPDARRVHDAPRRSLLNIGIVTRSSRRVSSVTEPYIAPPHPAVRYGKPQGGRRGVNAWRFIMNPLARPRAVRLRRERRKGRSLNRLYDLRFWFPSLAILVENRETSHGRPLAPPNSLAKCRVYCTLASAGVQRYYCATRDGDGDVRI